MMPLVDQGRKARRVNAMLSEGALETPTIAHKIFSLSYHFLLRE